MDYSDEYKRLLRRINDLEEKVDILKGKCNMLLLVIIVLVAVVTNIITKITIL